jgi:hypothetical protein
MELWNMNRKFFSLALGVAALGLLEWAGNSLAGDGVIEACGPEGCGHGVCRAETAKRKVPERCYSSGCEDFCLPRCGLFGGHKHCDEDGGDCAGKCEHVRTKKYLIVKVHEKEECYPKCVVEGGPSCAGNHACPAHVEQLPRPAQGVNLQPVPQPITTLPTPANRTTAPQRLSPYPTYGFGR